MNNKLKIIICPSDYKIKYLEELNNTTKLYNYKFMTKEEFFKNYYFDYDNNTLYYLMNKYNYNLDVCKVYLNNMRVIDISKDYKSSKLLFLKDLKKELISNNLLIFNNIFKEYIKDKEIIVKNYYDLDKYEEEVLNYKPDIPNTSINTSVYEYNTIEEEVNGVCLKIIELLNSGVDINKIYLTNVDNDYYYILSRLFKYYNIPINIDFKDSIYNTKVVKEYLSTGKLDLDNTNNNIINKKLINIISDLDSIEDKDIYNKLLIDKLKNTYFSPKILDNAVNIKNLNTYEFSDDEYVFVLGFNLDCLPSMYKDIDYITDNIKDEVGMYSTNYLNKRSKNITTYLLSRINNLYLSYKLSTPFRSFYKSSLINELGLNIIKEDTNNYNYSNIYNKIRLGESLDKYYLYGEKDNYLELLNTHYNINYNTYTNKYTGINNSLYLNKLKRPINFSYTTLNSYNECHFKYYIKYVLKLDDYEDTFSSFLGSLYHYILSKYKTPNFDFEKEWNAYLKRRELTKSEETLLIKIKKDLLELLNVLKKQNLITGFNNEVYEKEFTIKLNNKVDSNIIGFIDKIMLLNKNNNTYFSVIDYKTGNIDTHIEPMKYGLHLQLPIYLYLIKNSNINNPIFTGIYYQNILFNYPTWSKNIEKDIKDRYKLKGYSTDNTEVLEIFDTTFTDSELIKSMKYSDSGFSRYSKVLNEEEVNNLVDYTKDIINNSTKDILDSKFEINPKVYDKENISCKYCKYKDICYMKDKDLTYLDKVNDLDFLGGEE